MLLFSDASCASDASRALRLFNNMMLLSAVCRS